MVKKLAVVLAILSLWVTPSLAAGSGTATLPTSNGYAWVKTKEFVRLNLLTFKKTSKTRVLENFSQQRVAELQTAVSKNDFDAINPSLNRYESQKNKALDLAQKLADQTLLDQVKEKTLEQQKTMTELQISLKDNTTVQGNIIRVQKDIATRTVDTVTTVSGQDKGNEVQENIQKIWYAPGTSGDGPPAGWTYAPGTSKQTYAEGTTAGGDATNVQGTTQYAPGTTSGGTASGGTSSNVISGDQSTSGTGTNVIQGNSSTTPGTTSGGTGGQTVISN